MLRLKRTSAFDLYFQQSDITVSQETNPFVTFLSSLVTEVYGTHNLSPWIVINSLPTSDPSPYTTKNTPLTRIIL